MRILFLSNLYPPYDLGGDGLICANVNRAMSARGHVTHVLTSSHDVAGLGLPPGEVGVDRVLRMHGLYQHPWLGIRELRELEVFNNQKLHLLIEQFKPDVVHVASLSGLSKSLVLTLQRLGIPTAYFVSDHWVALGLRADVWLDWWNRPFPSKPARLCRTVWTMSGIRRVCDRVAPTDPVEAIQFSRIAFSSVSLREFTLRNGIAVGDAAVVRHSVDTVRFSGAPSPVTRPLVKWLYAGRLADDQGVMAVLRAMVTLPGQVSCSLCVCGTGGSAETSRLHAFVEEHRLSVTFIRATAEEMPGIYRAHDALLYVSNAVDLFAQVHLEAMACGLPVIAAAAGRSAELLRDGENALLVAPGDVEAMAGAMSTLMADPALRLRLATAGQRTVREQLAESLIHDQVEDYLQRAVAEAPTRPSASPFVH